MNKIWFYLAWIISLQDGFFVENILLEVQQTGLRVRATLDLVNKFPVDIKCSDISISIHTSLNNNDVKDKKPVRFDSTNLIIK